jgi:release factor glutamine methyltransferase
MLQLNRAELFLHGDRNITSQEKSRFLDMLEQRIQGRPMQYILGRTSFWSRDFHVTPDVLIPRPETEFVLEQALAVIRSCWPDASGLCLLDLGTGSGVIADVLAGELDCSVVGVDISRPALCVAEHNIAEHGLIDRVSLLCADMFSAFAPETRFDAIVANLPYVETDCRDQLDSEVIGFEPGLALFAGRDGLDCYRRCIAEAGEFLVRGGWLMLEIGAAQKEAIERLFAGHGFVDIAVRADYGGLPRFACARKGLA